MLSAGPPQIASRAAVPGDSSSVALPSAVLCLSAGALISEANTLPVPGLRIDRRRKEGDGEQEVMIRSVQVKLAPLITPLIGLWCRTRHPPTSPTLLSLSLGAVMSSGDQRGCVVNYK